MRFKLKRNVDNNILNKNQTGFRIQNLENKKCLPNYVIAKRGMKAAKWFPAVDTRLVLFSFLFTCLKHKEREGEEKDKEIKKERKEESTFS